MEFGLHLGVRGPAAEPDSLKVIATEAENLGFTHLGFSDHVVIAENVDSPYPYTKSGRWFAEDSGECLEQITTLGFVAAATTKIRLLTSVMVLPHRPPILTAKMLDTVDILSKGRLTIGLGVGWMAEEISLLNGPEFKDRGPASDEYIAAFKELWTNDSPCFKGKHINFSGLKFFPKPLQQPYPPLWIGGEAKLARQRAGRIGNGWYPVGNNPSAPFDTAARYSKGLKDVEEAAAAIGRSPMDITKGLLAIWYKLGQSDQTDQGTRRAFTGSQKEILQDVEEYRAVGLEHLIIGGESSDLNACLQRMRTFKKEIMSNV
tara:strand:+ start:1961 stop:2914 length:954 start_codon:yes stop_codon:yes gene_type:complete